MRYLTVSSYATVTFEETSTSTAAESNSRGLWLPAVSSSAIGAG